MIPVNPSAIFWLFVTGSAVGVTFGFALCWFLLRPVFVELEIARLRRD